VFCKDEPFSMTLCFENFNNNGEFDNIMDELANDECDGHKNYSLDESGEGKMERSSSNSLGEKSNEEGNEKRTKE